MARRTWRWGANAVHMSNKEKYDEGIRESICWVTGRRGVALTLNPDRVTCKFCRKILEGKHVDES